MPGLRDASGKTGDQRRYSGAPVRALRRTAVNGKLLRIQRNQFAGRYRHALQWNRSQTDSDQRVFRLQRVERAVADRTGQQVRVDAPRLLFVDDAVEIRVPEFQAQLVTALHDRSPQLL